MCPKGQRDFARSSVCATAGPSKQEKAPWSAVDPKEGTPVNLLSWGIGEYWDNVPYKRVLLEIKWKLLGQYMICGDYVGIVFPHSLLTTSK